MDKLTNGTLIPEGEYAVISAGEELSLVIPKMEDDEDVSDAGMFLTAVFVRYDKDPGFRDEMITWLTGRMNN